MSAVEPDALGVCRRLEETLMLGKGDVGLAINGISLMSIAISLKRIADEVCGVPYDHAPGADNSKHHMGLTDGVMHAIEQGILAASQRG